MNKLYKEYDDAQGKFQILIVLFITVVHCALWVGTKVFGIMMGREDATVTEFVIKLFVYIILSVFLWSVMAILITSAKQKMNDKKPNNIRFFKD